MQLIPVINCLDEQCVEDRLKIFESFGCRWVKFDISDGVFNPVITWNKPGDISNVFSGYNTEVHLMVEDVEVNLKKWLKAGATRPIIHIESSGFNIENVLSLCREYEKKPMLALKPDTSLKEIFPYLNGDKASVEYVQLLAVDPGESGQKFREHTLKRIKELKEEFPDVIIEVDGGVNKEVAERLKKAGVDIIVASSYIFNAEDPQKAFKELELIAMSNE